MTGALNFIQKQLKQHQYTSVFIITLPLFMVMVIGFEIKYRLKDLKGQLDFSKVKTKGVMSIDEF